LTHLIDRAQDVRQSATEPGRAIKQRMAEAAAELSRAGDNQQRVELLQEAVLAITKLCYDADPDGQPANLDSRTYRLLVPAPWGQRWLAALGPASLGSGDPSPDSNCTLPDAPSRAIVRL
jgi:hypothetical protein